MRIASSMQDLTQSIASSHEERTKTVAKVKEEAKRLTGDAQDLIRGFQTSRKQTGVQLRKDLAKDKASRESDVKKMLGDTRGLIKGFQASRRKEGAHLRKELTQSHASRKSKVRELLKSAQDLVTDLGKSRQETGEKLRKDLAKGRDDRESGVKEMRSEFRKSQAEVRSDIDETRAAWQELTRGVKKATVKATPKAVKAKVAKAAPAEEETSDLEAKLLAAIREHPQGITLTEVAQSLGVVPIVFGRAARKLVDEGRVRKEDKTYFPIARE